MGITATFYRLGRVQIETFLHDDSIDGTICDPDRSCELDKVWYALHELFQAVKPDEIFPAGFLLSGTPMSKGEEDEEMGPMPRWFTEEQTQMIAGFLESLDSKRLGADDEELDACYEELRDFFLEAARRRECTMLVFC